MVNMAASAGAATVQPTHPSAVRDGGRITPVAWTPGEGIAVNDWIRAGQRLGAMTRCSQWWLGDWVRYGTGRWGEKYKEAARITGYDVHSLRNIAYVAGRVEVSRRRDNLAWSHHAEVSALEPDEQDRWLDLASTEKMSVSDLRIELRAARRRNKAKEVPVVTRLREAVAGRVMCPECEHEFEVPVTKRTRLV
jgi:hypothetical protein